MASVGDVISLAETVSNYVTAVKDRFEKASENPRLISELLLRINDLKAKTAQVEDIRKANKMEFTTTILAAFDNEIRSIYQSLEGVYDELQSINAKLKSRRYRYVRANTVSTWLFEQFAEVSNLDKELLKLTMFFANAEVSAKVHRTTDAHLKNIASSVENPDKFRSSFHVPRNPPHVILKFGSNSEMSPIGPREVTLEAQLKQAIIRRDRKKSVGAIGSTTGHPVGMKGMSGVGKSCALRGLATDREVRERFPDGIYWLSLGKDCTVENIVRGVARITEQSGGIKIAKAIRDDADIEGAVSKGEQWFAGKRGLLLIDDVWDVVEIGRDIVRRLSQIVDAQKGSRVAFTTRDLHVAVGRSELIEFSSRNRVVSRQILLKAANVTEEDVCNLKSLVDDTLDLCAGLPMALSVAGSAVRMKREICPHVSMTQIWRAYVHVLRSQPGKLTRERATDDRYQNLRSAFQASLSMLDEKSASAHEWDMSYHEMYRALAVIQRQGWLPVSVLHLLWRLKDEFEAEEVVDKFTFASLAELKSGTMNGNKSLGISLHDLQLEFVEGECKLHGEEQKWHDRLVCAWRSVRNPDFVTGITEHPRWAVNQIFEDQYVRQNVCRHIVGAGRASELGDLVLDPEWAVKRLVAGEIFGLEGDLKVLEKNYKNSTFSAIEQGSVAWSVRMMAGAARLSAPYIAGSMREVYFQLYARLCDLRRHSELLQKYSSNIEKYAARPWLKAIRPCLSQPGGALREILTCEFRVDGVSASCRGWIAWGVDFGKERSYICTFVRGQLEKKVMLRRQTIRKSVYDEPNSSEEICKLSGERGTGVEIAVHQRCMWYSHIDVICCSEDARYAVTAYGDGAMQVWDLRSEERIGGELHGHSGRVLSIVWSPDKMRFASGGSDAKVKIWERQTGKIVGRELPLLPSRFCSSCCMAWSPDGKRLSYTGDDDIAKIWDFATGKAFELHGEHNLRCMSWSKDGLRLACGGRGHVSIWNTSTIEKVIILESNERQFFFCIAWSPNGNRLAAAADGDKVEIWNTETGIRVENSLRGYGFSVTHLQWCLDGSLLASAGADDTVRIWDMNSDEVPRDELLEHSGITRCVAWSSNESHLASGHVGGGVRIWDSESGAPIERVLKTQSKSVEYLAWSPDDSRLAYVNLNARVSAWEVATGKQIMEEIQNGERVVSTAWSPDGSLLAWGLEDSTVLVWYVHKHVLRMFRRMVRNDENYRSIRGVLRWSADGKQLTSCDLYDMSRMCTWDVTTGATITTAEENFFEKQKRITAEDASIFCHVEGHETRLATFEASNFAYSPSGQYIAVAHHSGLGLCKLVE